MFHQRKKPLAKSPRTEMQISVSNAAICFTVASVVVGFQLKPCALRPGNISCYFRNVLECINHANHVIPLDLQILILGKTIAMHKENGKEKF